MDILSLFSGSDNLYKHLFIGGLGMIILSLFYPLEKQNQLNTQKDTYNKEIRILNLEIEYLKKDVEDLEKDSHSYIQIAEGLSKQKSRQAKKLKEGIKNNFNKRLDTIESNRKQIALKEANQAYNKDAIATLEKNIDSYNRYTGLLYYGGIVFMSVGIIGWWYITHYKLKENK